jgi:4-oxalocrotonate tautomerase
MPGNLPKECRVILPITEYSITLIWRKEDAMPYVNVKVTKDGVTPDQKARLIKGITNLLADVLGKNPQTTVVIIEEIDMDNWGIGGETVTVRRKRKV